MSARDKLAALAAKSNTIVVEGVTIELRSLTGRQVLDLAGKRDSPIADQNALLIGLSCYDPETGGRIWGDEDLDAIADLRADTYAELVQQCLRGSGLTDKALDEAKQDLTTAPSSESKPS